MMIMTMIDDRDDYWWIWWSFGPGKVLDGDCHTSILIQENALKYDDGICKIGTILFKFQYAKTLIILSQSWH